MGQFIDLTGNRYGELVVLKRLPNQGRRLMWLCQCDCGKTAVVEGGHLKSGHTKSCGCFVSNNPSRFTHHETGTRLYRIWQAMKNRCRNPKVQFYRCYGGRGVRVCEEWETDFTAFKEWALSHGYKEGLTIDRIDVNGDYEPNNCRWATNKEQANNTRRNRIITFSGESKTISEWASILGINYHTLHSRIQNGWSLERALCK